MFDNLTGRLQATFKNIRGQGRLTEDNIKETMREVRMALLEADVALPVVKEFTETVKQRALGQEVMQSLSPGQAMLKIVNDELINTMGEANESLNLSAAPPVVILTAGLQGSGKTTTAAKLAKYLKEKEKRNPCLVSVDIYRPAAIEQLRILSEQIKIPFIENDSKNVVELCVSAQEHAYNNGFDTLIIDKKYRGKKLSNLLMSFNNIIIKQSGFFSFLISTICFLTSKFLWITPIPPALAIAIAIFASVTVSIADDNKGIFNNKFLDNFVSVFTSEGNISEYLGASVTSSKVSASFIVSIIIYI